MRIGNPLLKLPVRFCGETLAREVSGLPAESWIEHPQKYDGNIAVPLISPGGEITQAAFGPMAATPWLQQCPYILEILRALQSTWGRSRLMGLHAGAVVPRHVDIHYYWRTHLRMHIPVITNPEVAFTCAGETIHMAPGECWILDSFFDHEVANRGSETRIHLVLDTVGSARLWDLILAARSGRTADDKILMPGEAPPGPIEFEQVNAPSIMSPWEMQSHIAYLSDWTNEQPGRSEILAIVDRFLMAWTGAWARFGTSHDGLSRYADLLEDVHRSLTRLAGPPVMMRNGRQLIDAIRRFILANAISPDLIQQMQDAEAPKT